MLTPYTHATSVAATLPTPLLQSTPPTPLLLQPTPPTPLLPTPRHAEKTLRPSEAPSQHRPAAPRRPTPAEVDNAARRPTPAEVHTLHLRQFIFLHNPKFFFLLTPAATPRPIAEPRPKFFFFLTKTQVHTLHLRLFFFHTPKFYIFHTPKFYIILLTPAATPRPTVDTKNQVLLSHTGCDSKTHCRNQDPSSSFTPQTLTRKERTNENQTDPDRPNKAPILLQKSEPVNTPQAPTRTRALE